MISYTHSFIYQYLSPYLFGQQFPTEDDFAHKGTVGNA